MKVSVIIGAVLIALGIGALVYKSVSYKTEETVVQLGPLKATTETEKQIPIPTWAGVAAIVAGVAVIVFGGRK